MKAPQLSCQHLAPSISIFIAIFLIALPSCKNAGTKHEMNKLKRSSQKMTEIAVDWQALDARPPEMAPNVEATLKKGLTRQDTVSLALLNNHQLQADFESLGIAKADLVQAGLYTNPEMISIFEFPLMNKKSEPFAEITLTFSVNDLWQVPLRKKVAQKELEITTKRILSTILDTIDETKKAYNDCLFALGKYDIIQKNIAMAKKINDDVRGLQKGDAMGDMDVDLAVIPTYEWKIESLDAENLRDVSFSKLCNLIGVPPSFIPLKLLDKLEFGSLKGLPKPEEFIEFALKNRPEMQIARLKVQQAHDSLDLERANFIHHLDFGLDYSKDIDGEKRVGMALFFDIPIFDNNYAQIDRACYAAKEAERQFEATKISIMNDVFQAHNNLDGSDEVIELHAKKLKAYEHALPLAHKYLENRNSLNVINTLQVYDGQYREQIAYLQSQQETFNAFADLEKAIGHLLHPERDTWAMVLKVASSREPLTPKPSQNRHNDVFKIKQVCSEN